MKVIGTPVYYDVDCIWCGAIIRFTLDDVKESAYKARYINCPLCGEKIQTHYNDWDRPHLNANVRTRFKEDTIVNDEQNKK